MWEITGIHQDGVYLVGYVTLRIHHYVWYNSEIDLKFTISWYGSQKWTKLYDYDIQGSTYPIARRPRASEIARHASGFLAKLQLIKRSPAETSNWSCQPGGHYQHCWISTLSFSQVTATDIHTDFEENISNVFNHSCCACWWPCYMNW